jgi:mono/diheme cytochrome c family protein
MSERKRRGRGKRFTPWEPDRPIPWGVFSIAFVLALWGAWMLWANSADTPAPSLATIDPNAATVTGSVFDSHCATCHQPNGVGVGAAVPPLAGSRYVQADPAVAVQILLHGLQGPISVRGQVYDGRMPTFGPVLTDAQIAATLTEIRASWGNDAEPVTEGFVAAQRERFPDRGPWQGEAELTRTLAVELGSAPDSVAANQAPEENP